MKVSLEQIGFLKHAIGLRNDRIKGRKYRKYEAFRNHFNTGENSDNFDSLNQLVDLGLMTRRICNLSDGYNFHVTEEGFKYLSRLLEVEITELD